MSSRPWAEGKSLEERWWGYFVAPESDVLRNLVGATTAEGLADAENDLLEVRLLELREGPTLVSRTYDLTHICALHRHLFQDVFRWAGELRTVGIAKGDGESFIPPCDIVRPIEHVASRIAESDLLRNIGAQDLPHTVAYLYDYLNFAHPFREGNGRTQREFFDQLLAESGHGLNWQVVDKRELHDVCHRARNDDDLAPMVALFRKIVNDSPTYPRSKPR